MVSRRANTKTSAKETARKMRRKGYDVSIYKKRKGYGVSVTRK